MLLHCRFQILIMMFLCLQKKNTHPLALGQWNQKARGQTLFRIALNISLTLPPLYFLYLPKLPVNVLSNREYQSLPTTLCAPCSRSTSVGSAGSVCMISNRSEASHRKPRRLAAGQKMGWVRHSDVDGLTNAKMRVSLGERNERKEKRTLRRARYSTTSSPNLPLLLFPPLINSTYPYSQLRP